MEELGHRGRKFLIDACQGEVRLAIMSPAGELVDFFSESQTGAYLKGNIYLGQISNVEPSLQAAFVDFGEERRGFLPFSEIHPDYFRGPIRHQKDLQKIAQSDYGKKDSYVEGQEGLPKSLKDMPLEESEKELLPGLEQAREDPSTGDGLGEISLEEKPEVDQRLQDLLAYKQRLFTSFRVPEILKKNQWILVQVVKDPRGQKGAALTTHLSISGRYCIFLPNTASLLGVSKKIVQEKERERLKEMMIEIGFPKEQGLIVRTAGEGKSKAELKRDTDYLSRLWRDLCEKIPGNQSPGLLHQEGDLMTRIVRDLYKQDVEEIFVEGESNYRRVKKIMGFFMPSHRKKIQLYRQSIPLFQRYDLEEKIQSLFRPQISLPSGGHIVIQPTEALISIDVNSGKSTREKNIEETAFRTNMEAAALIPGQLKMRDLGGLIVVDFIDMSLKKNMEKVEQTMEERFREDKAKIQMGTISQFGLLEISRQRLRPNILENFTTLCQTCEGQGRTPSLETVVIEVFRTLNTLGGMKAHLQEKGKKGEREWWNSGVSVEIHCREALAFALSNSKRQALMDLEKAGLTIAVTLVTEGPTCLENFYIRCKKESSDPAGEGHPRFKDFPKHFYEALDRIKAKAKREKASMQAAFSLEEAKEEAQKSKSRALAGGVVPLHISSTVTLSQGPRLKVEEGLKIRFFWLGSRPKKCQTGPTSGPGSVSEEVALLSQMAPWQCLDNRPLQATFDPLGLGRKGLFSLSTSACSAPRKPSVRRGRGSKVRG